MTEPLTAEELQDLPARAADYYPCDDGETGPNTYDEDDVTCGRCRLWLRQKAEYEQQQRKEHTPMTHASIPLSQKDGALQPHFADCPKAASFKRPR